LKPLRKAFMPCLEAVRDPSACQLHSITMSWNNASAPRCVVDHIWFVGFCWHMTYMTYVWPIYIYIYDMCIMCGCAEVSHYCTHGQSNAPSKWLAWPSQGQTLCCHSAQWDCDQKWPKQEQFNSSTVQQFNSSRFFHGETCQNMSTYHRILINDDGFRWN
jgi:hypothetical protein